MMSSDSSNSSSLIVSGGLKLSVFPFGRHGQQTHQDVEAAILAELRDRGLPHAFLGGNDLIALAAFNTLESLGYKVPEDVLLTAFNAFGL